MITVILSLLVYFHRESYAINPFQSIISIPNQSIFKSKQDKDMFTNNILYHYFDAKDTLKQCCSNISIFTHKFSDFVNDRIIHRGQKLNDISSKNNDVLTFHKSSKIQEILSVIRKYVDSFSFIYIRFIEYLSSSILSVGSHLYLYGMTHRRSITVAGMVGFVGIVGKYCFIIFFII